MNDFVSGKTVKIRKVQKCWGCAGRFMPGTELQRLVFVDAGKIATVYYCPVCQAYWNEYMHTGDEINMGELRDEDPEGWDALAAEISTVPAKQGGGQ